MFEQLVIFHTFRKEGLRKKVRVRVVAEAPTRDSGTQKEGKVAQKGDWPKKPSRKSTKTGEGAGG